MKPNREDVEVLSRQMADSGRLIEIGWLTYKHMVMSPEASPIQYRECRLAFFAGAQHLFGTLLVALDPNNTEPTEEDLKKMELVDKELRQFVEEVKKRL